MNIVEQTIRRVFEDTCTAEEFRQGYADISVTRFDGTNQIIRLSAPDNSDRRTWIVTRYAATDDMRSVILPMMAPEFATNEFLNSISPDAVIRLAMRAFALLLGPENLRQLAGTMGLGNTNS